MSAFKAMVFCALVLVSMSGSAAWADEADDKAVQFIEKLGGKVTRDDKAPGKPVVGVSLFKTQVTDAGLKELAPLKNLTSLNLVGTKATDAGLKELAPLKNLTTLDLSDTKATDASLKELAPLQNLTELYLYGTKVTDAGVKEFQKALPKCKIRR
jgi:uncharacterized protein YjbI with pentapeptide repeats